MWTSSLEQPTKHIDIRSKWIQELLDSEQIRVEYVPMEYQAADILTKPLPKKKFDWNRNSLMASITMICILPIVGGYKFSRVEPVFYKETSKPYINGIMGMELLVLITPYPCNSYFKNLTGDIELDTQVLDTCNSWFKQDTVDRLKFCHSDHPIEIAVIDDRVIHSIHKRFVGAIAAVAVIGPTVAYMVHETRVLKSSIKELQDKLNLDHEFLNELTASLNETRNTIHEMDDRLLVMEAKIGQLNETIKATSKTYALLSNVFHYLEDIKEEIMNIDRQAGKGKVSTSLMSLIKKDLWTEPAETWSKLETCSYRFDNSGLKLTVKFEIPMIDPTSKILEAHSLKLWNFTSENFACRVKYSGPRYVLANRTTNCIMGIDTNWIDEGTLQGHPCLENNNRIQDTFHKEFCSKFTPSSDDIQIKIFNGFNRIYCMGFNILLNSNNESCTHFVFDLPLTQSFVLNHHHHDTSTIKKEFPVNINEIQMNKVIRKTFKIDEMRIHGPNIGKLDKHVDKMNSMLKLLNKNLTIEHSDLEDFMSSISAPWEWIGSMWNRFWEILKDGFYFVTLIVGVLIISILIRLIYIFRYVIAKFLGIIYFLWPSRKVDNNKFVVVGRNKYRNMDLENYV